MADCRRSALPFRRVQGRKVQVEFGGRTRANGCYANVQTPWSITTAPS